MRIIPLVSILALTLLVSSCTSGGGSTDSGTSNPQIKAQKFTVTTDASGKGAFAFNLPAGYTSFQVEAKISDSSRQGRMFEILDPTGKVLLDEATPSNRTTANLFTSKPVFADVPLLYGSVPTGDYSVTLEVKPKGKRDTIEGLQFEVAVYMKRDSDLNSGSLRVNMVLVGPASDSSDMRDGFEAALEIWKEIYARAGISLDPKWYDWSGPGTIPNPVDGDVFYQAISEAVRPNSLNVVIGNDVRGTDQSQSGSKYGIAGSLPGPVGPSIHSAIAMSALELSGRDGKFNYGNDSGPTIREPGASQVHNDETRLAAEELARLAAHYLGLGDSVEFRSSSSATGADALTDTPSCTTNTNCRLDGDSRSNLMFPYPLQEYREQGDAGRRTEYYARDQITPQQRSVLNRHPLVD